MFMLISPGPLLERVEYLFLEVSVYNHGGSVFTPCLTWNTRQRMKRLVINLFSYNKWLRVLFSHFFTKKSLFLSTCDVPRNKKKVAAFFAAQKKGLTEKHKNMVNLKFPLLPNFLEKRLFEHQVLEKRCRDLHIPCLVIFSNLQMEHKRREFILGIIL